MELDDEERRLIEQHRAARKAEENAWKPLAIEEVTAEMAMEAFAKLHKMALVWFNRSDCDHMDCHCKPFFFEAAMEALLARPFEGKKMWNAINRNR